MAYGENVQAMWQYLTREMGISPIHAAGVLGNVAGESSFDPTAFNKQEGAYGSFQHAGPRYAALQQFARDRNLPIGEFPTQAQFFGQEIAGPEKAAWEKVQQADNPADAARAFDQHYERSAGLSREKRAKTAVEIYNTFAGNPDAAPLAVYTPQQTMMDPAGPQDIAAAPPMVQQGPQNMLNMGPVAAAPPEEAPQATIDIGAGLASLGKALGQMSRGQPVDLTSVGQQFYQRREKLRQEEEVKKKQAAISEALKGYPGGDKVAGLVQAGVPVSDALEMIKAEQQMAHQEKMQTNDFGFRRTESALDRTQQRELAEAGYAIDYARLDQDARQFTMEHDLSRERFAEASQQFAQTHGLAERQFTQAADQFIQTFGLDKDRLNQNAEQFAETMGLNKEQFAQHVKEFTATHGLSERQFAHDQATWTEQMAYEKLKYEKGVADERVQGEAGREAVARAFEHAGDKDTAEYIRARDPEAFADPAMVGQFLQVTDQMLPKNMMTTDMKNFLAAQNDKEFAKHLLDQAPGGTPEYTKAFYKYLAAQDENLIKAKEVLSSAENMSNILTISEQELGDVVRTGRVAEFFQPVAEVIKEAGLAPPKFEKITTYRELINMIHNDIFPKLRAVGSGSTSDWEGQIMSSAFPGLADSPEAIRTQLNFYMARTERNLAEQKFLRGYADAGKKQSEAEADWAKLVQEGDPRTLPAMYSDQMKPENFINGFKSGAVKIGDYVHIDGKLHKVNQAMMDAMQNEGMQ